MEGRHTIPSTQVLCQKNATLLIVELVSDLTVWTMIAPLVFKNRDFS
jgi:hypothetical protein